MAICHGCFATLFADFVGLRGESPQNPAHLGFPAGRYLWYLANRKKLMPSKLDTSVLPSNDVFVEGDFVVEHLEKFPLNIVFDQTEIATSFEKYVNCFFKNLLKMSEYVY